MAVMRPISLSKISECREILTLLPVAHLGVEAVDLGLLKLKVIVDEEIAEAGAEDLSSRKAASASSSERGSGVASVS